MKTNKSDFDKSMKEFKKLPEKKQIAILKGSPEITVSKSEAGGKLPPSLQSEVLANSADLEQPDWKNRFHVRFDCTQKECPNKCYTLIAHTKESPLFDDEALDEIKAFISQERTTLLEELREFISCIDHKYINEDYRHGTNYIKHEAIEYIKAKIKALK